MSNLTTRQHICKYIDEWLNRNKINNNVFSKAIGVSNNSVMRWRSGICAPDIDLFSKICEYMNISISELLGFDTAKDLTLNQVDILNTYNNDMSFKTLIDLYREDDEIKYTINLLVKRIK